MESHTVENYLKAIYRLGTEGNNKVSTSSIAEALQNNPATVSDMIKKLTDKELIHYERSSGVILSGKGLKLAIKVIRKHRLWETFLATKLGFKWDEVHEVAEQLEHVHSEMLIDKLEAFLDYPVSDPHGDPIPNKKGEIPKVKMVPLSETEVEHTYLISGVSNDSAEFLQFLDKKEIKLHDEVTLLEREQYDGSVKIRLKNDQEIYLSKTVADNLMIAVSV